MSMDALNLELIEMKKQMNTAASLLTEALKIVGAQEMAITKLNDRINGMDAATLSALTNNIEKSDASEKATKNDKHVMISYQWDSQPMVKCVYDKLTKSGIKVWLDIAGDMSGNINDAMADGVENAAVIVPVMTQKYQDSRNCSKELNYADTLQIPLVPLMGQKQWQARGWLGALTAGKLWVDTSWETDAEREANIDKAAEMLVSEIKNIMGAKATASTVAKAPAAPKKFVAPPLPADMLVWRPDMILETSFSAFETPSLIGEVTVTFDKPGSSYRGVLLKYDHVTKHADVKFCTGSLYTFSADGKVVKSSGSWKPGFCVKCMTIIPKTFLETAPLFEWLDQTIFTANHCIVTFGNGKDYAGQFTGYDKEKRHLALKFETGSDYVFDSGGKVVSTTGGFKVGHQTKSIKIGAVIEFGGPSFYTNDKSKATFDMDTITSAEELVIEFGNKNFYRSKLQAFEENAMIIKFYTGSTYKISSKGEVLSSTGGYKVGHQCRSLHLVKKEYEESDPFFRQLDQLPESALNGTRVIVTFGNGKDFGGSITGYISKQRQVKIHFDTGSNYTFDSQNKVVTTTGGFKVGHEARAIRPAARLQWI